MAVRLIFHRPARELKTNSATMGAMVIRRDGRPQHQGLGLKMTLPTHDALPGHLGSHQHRQVRHLIWSRPAHTLALLHQTTYLSSILTPSCLIPLNQIFQILPPRKSLLRPPTIRRTRNSPTHLTPQTKLHLIIQPPELILRTPLPVLPTPRVIRSHHLGYALYNQPSCRESPLRLGAASANVLFK